MNTPEGWARLGMPNPGRGIAARTRSRFTRKTTKLLIRTYEANGWVGWARPTLPNPGGRPADPETKAPAIAAARAELVRTAGGLETEQGETEESDHE